MESIKNSITKGITTINVKTNNMLEENKSKTFISTLEKDIVELQKKAGSMVYDKWKAGTLNFDGLEEVMQKIDEKKEAIREQEAHIKKLQAEEQKILGGEHAAGGDAVFCSMCGAQNKNGYKFCVKCGAQL